MTSEDQAKFEEILDRLKEAAGAVGDADLAAKLGLTRSSISTAKTRAMVPPSWIINAANLFKVSADWLIFGRDAPPRPSGPDDSASAAAGPSEQRQLEELVTAYKKIIALQEDNERLRTEIAGLKRGRSG